MASTSSTDTEPTEKTVKISEKENEVKIVTPSRKRRHVDVESPRVQRDDDDGMTCSVCLDVWTSAGAHRLCALKCGHLFGRSCVTRWLSGKQKVCPQCNTPARKNDIREIYATKLVVVDTGEVEDLRLKCSHLQAENVDLVSRLTMHKNLVDFYKAQCEKIAENNEAAIGRELTAIKDSELFKPRILLSVKLDGPSRVMAYNHHQDVIAVSQEHVGPLWPGFGVRLFSNQGEQMSAHQPMHKKEMRDAAFHPQNPDLLLTVGLDRCAKVTDVVNKKTIFGWCSNNRVWSCCWDSEVYDVAYVGTERGQVIRLLIENSDPSSDIILPCDHPDVKPVAVIALFSSKKLRSLFCCRLLSVSSYTSEGDDPNQWRMQLLWSGKFCAMTLNESSFDDDVIMVLTCRPNGNSTSVRHLCFKLRQVQNDDGTSLELIQQHTICGGTEYSQLFRPSLFSTPKGPLFFSFNESNSMVVGWNIGGEDAKKVVSIKVHDMARHLVAVSFENQLTLYILMPTLLKSYTMNVQ